jgi:serine/threonine protein kinase
MHIVHRDLKPDNILVSPNGHVAIADFGFAKQCSKDLWANGRIRGAMGTPGYMAPEVLFSHLAGDGSSYAIDIWGFGMILLELLLGEVRSSFSFDFS